MGEGVLGGGVGFEGLWASGGRWSLPAIIF